MKNLALVAAVLLLFTQCQTRNTLIPPRTVESAFLQRYPNIADAQWTIDPHNHYRVQFMNGNRSNVMLFGTDGSVISSGTKGDWVNVPGTVRDAHTRSQFGTWQTGEVYFMETPAGERFYSIDVINGEEGQTIYYDSHGMERKF